MRVVLAAIGSRGDVLPFAQLAARFAEAGHDVAVITHAGARGLVDPALPVVPVASDAHTLLAGPAAEAVRRVSLGRLNRTRDLFADFVHSAAEPARQVLPGADVLVASTFAIAAVDEALRLSVPVVRAHMWPEYPGPDGPLPLLPYGWRAPDAVRRVATRSLRRAEPYLGGVHGRWRRGRLQLTARHPVGLTTHTAGSLYAFSPELVPDAPASGTVTGWWTGPGGALSPAVAAALEDGDDWIHVGFGSMDQADPAELLDRLATACERAGVRAVVQLGDLRGRPHPRLLCIGDEPHAALFRHVRAAVHHGGAGTTGSVVRAGLPSVVVPHFADQFYWGARLQALGVAARPVPRPFLSSRSLTRALEEALSRILAHNAAGLAARVRGEDGCGRAVRRVEEWVSRPARVSA